VNHLSLKSELIQEVVIIDLKLKSELFQEDRMDQLHKRFSSQQVKMLFQQYLKGDMNRVEIQEVLGLGKTRFFALLKAYKKGLDDFQIHYQRTTRARLSEEAEAGIAEALKREKMLVEDPRLPITSYNYTALRDRLLKQDIQVSVPTIIQRAKQLECYKSQRQHKVHTREVLTTAIGALIQHDASIHLWSPFAEQKWTLITSIDDYSRMLLFADLVFQETSWEHIQAAQTLMQMYGFPLRYYVDNLRVFRFVQGRDAVWRKSILETDDVITQWRQMMAVLKVDVTYALSPQAKGKVERPYRWLQDRLVRTCALEHLSSIEEVRAVLRDEVERYNNHQVHSTTGEIPQIRFEKATHSGNSLFRPFTLPKPYTSTKDVFCLHSTRMVNGYRKISLFNELIEVPNVPLRDYVDVHMVPDPSRQVLEARVWYHSKLVRSVHFPFPKNWVHF
jgi:ribosomal protein S13